MSWFDPAKRQPEALKPAPPAHRTRIAATMAMFAIAALFMLSVAMAITQISSGVKTAAKGTMHGPITSEPAARSS
jgi:hypothetical protein